MGKFAKTQILGWKLGWKVKLKLTGLSGHDRFLGTEALW